MFKKAKKISNKVKTRFTKFAVYGVICPVIYYINCFKKVQEDKVVFIELRHNNMTNSFEVLYNQLRNEYNLEIHCHFMNLNNKSRRALIKRAIELMEDVATAKYIFLNESNTFFSKLSIRKETKLIQLWHGCGAFKKFGHSTAEFIFGASKKEMDKYPSSKNIDLITVSSDEVIWAYEEALNKPKGSEIVKDLGVSRTDIFFRDEIIENARVKLEKLFPEAKGKKVILYAPTFRGRVAKAVIPDMLRIDDFCKELSDEYVLLYKYHPLVKRKPIINEENLSFARNMTELMSIEDLLCVTDICISDYSSLIYEFSLFEKPMAFYAYDTDEFCDWRGFYYDYDDLTPGPVCKTNSELLHYIKNIDTLFDKKEVKAFKDKFMKSCDGNATKRIIEDVFGESLAKYKKQTQTNYNYAKLLSGENFFSETKNKMPEIPEIKTNLHGIEYEGGKLIKGDKKVKVVYKPVYRTWVGLEKQKVYLDLQYLAEKLSGELEIYLCMPEKTTNKAFPLVKYLGNFVKVVEGELTKSLKETADLIILDYDIKTYVELSGKKPIYLYKPDNKIYEACTEKEVITSDYIINDEDDLIELIGSKDRV